ncbi:hypothetical protein NJF54_14675 [Pseudomonas guariconensis]|uniref:hypothetical protein n=1 Tax=Pseudomonas guariconensis TaxID=1288410 RepID=UPI00209B363D|nr:hypothetical protein [Pseudomonas guariconensis]MCO7633075.1 hypothetical protein [Pseudomonas guariconensis]
MLDLLKLLWPDFSLLFSAETNGVSAWFWIATAAIFAISVIFVGLHVVSWRSDKLLVTKNRMAIGTNTLAFRRPC